VTTETKLNNDLMVEYYKEQIKELEAAYGTGIRPSWVSAEVAYYLGKLKSFKQPQEG